MGLSSREIGKALGVSHTAIGKAAKRGRIPRETDGTFDLEKVRAAWVPNADQHQRARSAKKPAKPETAAPRHSHGRTRVETLQEAQRRKESAQANIRELEYRKSIGELVETEAVKQEWAGVLSALRNQLLLMPAKLAPKLAVLSDIRQCHAVIDAEIKQALTQLSQGAA